MVMLWGEDGIMIYNDAYSVFAGGRHPQLLGSKVRDGWPEVADFNDNVMKVGLAGGTLAYRNQELTLHRNGRPEPVWMNLDYSPVYDESDKPAGVIAIVVETTDKVLADRREAAIVERQRHMLRQMPGFVAMLGGPDFVYEYVNDAYVSISERTDFIGRGFKEVFPDIANQGFFELLDKVYQSGEGIVSRGMELRLHGSDDAQYIDFVFEPIRDDEGAVSGIFIGGYETTEAHRATLALRQSEERLRQANVVLEAQALERTAERNRVWTMSRDLLAVMGFDGFLKEINPAWEKILGRDTATLLSLPFPEQVHPDDHVLIAELVKRLEAGETVERFEDRLRHADGSWRWISWTLVPGDDVFYAVGRDITDEKARSEELQQAQEALRQSQKMEAVGQLTGGLAHDFNNILAGISGSLQLMSTRLAQGRSAELDRYITAASGAAHRAAGLTQRLLAFSRRQTLEPKPTNLNTLVSGMLELINRSVGPTIEVEAAAMSGLWTTFVDAGQLENALLNLCINARDAMPDGGKLTIETGNRWMDERGARQHNMAPGQYVSLCVSDTGTGMTPEVIERAFDPFFTTKPIGQGTGLGLSMVHGFAGQSGGTVRIYSEVGNGTMVCIYLPRHMADAGNDQTFEVTEDAPRAEQGQTVLLVDDEPLVRMIAAEALEELGYTVIEAADGASALKILSSAQPIDLLVTDVGLPGGTNGRQVADAARVTRPDLKVLFITGYAENAVLNHGHLSPGMQVLTKPFQIDSLARRVKELIEE
jgi:PAS domain S-box-containing protein